MKSRAIRSRDAGPSKTAVDVLVVSLATTLGLQRSDEQLVLGLQRLGYSVELTTPDVDVWRNRLGRFAFRTPFLDLSEAWASRVATSQAVQAYSPRAIVYTTTTAALLEPLRRRRRSALRFDALARENRFGRGSALLRFLERLTLRRAFALMPLSESPRYRDLPLLSPVPPLVVAGVGGPKDEHLAMCYVSGPKKRLDLILEAWTISRSAEAGKRLVVAGLNSRNAARAPDSALVLPPGVTLLGRPDHANFRAWTGRASVFIAAVDHEEFGIAQLEALADGAILVTTRAAGNYEALQIVDNFARELTAATGDPVDLARGLTAAWSMDDAAIGRYIQSARRHLEKFNQAAFDENLSKALRRLWDAK